MCSAFPVNRQPNRRSSLNLSKHGWCNTVNSRMAALVLTVVLVGTMKLDKFSSLYQHHFDELSIRHLTEIFEL